MAGSPRPPTPYLSRISSASISALGITGMTLRLASKTSGLSGRMALEMTTTSAASRFSGACPWEMRPPRPARRRVVSLSDRSDPLTSKPWLISTSAMPLMPMPPIPTKWMRCTLPLNIKSILVLCALCALCALCV